MYPTDQQRNRGAREERSHAKVIQRVLRSMSAASIIAVIASLLLANWRITTGLFLGGILSLLNFHWLSNSIDAAFNRVEKGARPRIRLAQYVLRYFVVGGLVYAGYKLNWISLPATIIGLSSFVLALFAEAVRESYLILVQREETN